MWEQVVRRPTSPQHLTPCDESPSHSSSCHSWILLGCFPTTTWAFIHLQLQLLPNHFTQGYTAWFMCAVFSGSHQWDHQRRLLYIRSREELKPTFNWVFIQSFIICVSCFYVSSFISSRPLKWCFCQASANWSDTSADRFGQLLQLHQIQSVSAVKNKT